MSIVEIDTITDEIVSALARLIPQLSASAQAPNRDALERIVASPDAALFVARDPEGDGRIVGTATLVLVRIPTGVRAWIEDVVVDGPARGRGIGAALVEAALQRARTAGAASVELTSRPAREAANRLYRRLGFRQRATNVYRFRFDDSSTPESAQP